MYVGLIIQAPLGSTHLLSTIRTNTHTQNDIKILEGHDNIQSLFPMKRLWRSLVILTHTEPGPQLWFFKWFFICTISPPWPTSPSIRSLRCLRGKILASNSVCLWRSGASYTVKRSKSTINLKLWLLELKTNQVFAIVFKNTYTAFLWKQSNRCWSLQ